METNPNQEPKYPDHLEEGQTPADIYPHWVDENNIVLTKDDIDHIPALLELFRMTNAYYKAPKYVLKEGEDYHKLDEEKSGEIMRDMGREKFKGIGIAYEKLKSPISHFILYYGRHVKPIKFDYELKWPSKRTPYQDIIYNEAGIGYRNLDLFIPSYEHIRDMVLEAIDWYYRNDSSRGSIITILSRKVSDLTGNQYLALLKEDRRRIEFDKQLEGLY